MIDADVWNHGLRKNMPAHYKAFYKLWSLGPMEHIHSRPKLAKFEKDEWGEIQPVQNPRIYVIYPEQFHQGLWGGEGVIKGTKEREHSRHRNFKPPPAKYWWPQLYEGVVHSEILQKHIELVVTKRGVQLVDQASGFDNYLLKTPVNEVYATGLLRIKRELLLALASPQKLASSIVEKYASHAVSFEEADWHGLTLEEAKEKQQAIEEQQKRDQTIPDKLRFRRIMLHQLRQGELDLELENIGSSQGDGAMGSLKNKILGR